MRQINAIKKLCTILNISDPGSLSYNADKVSKWPSGHDPHFIFTLNGGYFKIPMLTLKSNEKITGFVTILTHLMESTKNKSFALREEDNLEQSLQVNQWLEYGNLYVHTISMSDDKHLVKALLDELNRYLVIKSYLVGETLTVADLVVYFFIQDTMVSGGIEGASSGYGVY